MGTVVSGVIVVACAGLLGSSDGLTRVLGGIGLAFGTLLLVVCEVVLMRAVQ